jgi:hypothetical protein
MSPARHRDYAAEYERRKAKAAAAGTTVFGQRRARLAPKGFTTAQAGGHASAGAPSVSEFRRDREWRAPFFGMAPAGPGLVDVPLTFYEAQDAGRLMQLAQSLDRGDIAPGEYEVEARRTGSIAGIPVVTDPATAVALVVSTASDDLVFDSPRAGGTARRR